MGQDRLYLVSDHLHRIEQLSEFFAGDAALFLRDFADGPARFVGGMSERCRAFVADLRRQCRR